MTIRATLAFVLGIGVALPACAQAPRMVAPDEAPAFHAVGRLNIAGRRFCTATLIAPDLVLTAAHCLFHPLTGARVPSREMRFVAGFHLGSAVAVRRVARAVADPAFGFDGSPDYAGVRADLALLELDEPITAELVSALPLLSATDPEALRSGALAIVAYRRDRSQALSIEEPCGIVGALGGVVGLDCAVTFGASGAPLLRRGEGAATVVGVVSAIGKDVDRQEPVTLAVLLPGDRLAALRSLLSREPRAAPPARPRQP